MCVFQYGVLPGREAQTLNFVNAVHPIHPEGGIEQTVEAFCEFYKDRQDKSVMYVYDHTATNRWPGRPSFKETAIEAWEAKGWTVYEVYLGKAPEQHDKFESIKKMMVRDRFMANELRARPALTSMEKAGALTVGKKTGKDKTQEKKKNDPVEQTDYSDAVDMVLWADEIGLISPETGVFVGDLSTR